MSTFAVNELELSVVALSNLPGATEFAWRNSPNDRVLVVRDI
jgi:hypothetical protein